MTTYLAKGKPCIRRPKLSKPAILYGADKFLPRLPSGTQNEELGYLRMKQTFFCNQVNSGQGQAKRYCKNLCKVEMHVDFEKFEFSIEKLPHKHHLERLLE